MVDDEFHREAAGMPAAGNQSVPSARCRARRIDMKPLRIEFAREASDLLFGHGDRPGVDQLSCMKLFELHTDTDDVDMTARSLSVETNVVEVHRLVIDRHARWRDPARVFAGLNDTFHQ